VSTILSPFLTNNGPTSPAGGNVLFGLLAYIRREIQRTFFNTGPTITYNPALTTQGLDGVVTGNIGAVDADGNPLTYYVVQKPQFGTVTIDQATGNFTYTPVVDFDTLGGTDSFAVTVTSTPGPNEFRSPAEALASVVRSIPIIGGLAGPAPAPQIDQATTVTQLTITGENPGAALAFPDGFHWGVATAAFQYEMGNGTPVDPNTDFWAWTHDPQKIANGWVTGVPENGPGGYTQYASDAQLAAQGVGANTFRMSVAWSQIFPDSTASVDVTNGMTEQTMEELDALADPEAVAHYRAVFDALHANGLEPLVTLEHFTLPLWIHDPIAARDIESAGGEPDTQAGWIDPNTTTEFEKYAAYMAWKFGDQVDDWTTVNEPVNNSITSYLNLPGTTPGFHPGVLRPDLFERDLIEQANANVAAYKAIHQFDSTADVGFVLNMISWQPLDATNADDVAATALINDFYNKWYPNAVIKGEVDANFDGVITADEIHPEMAGSADWFGINNYGLMYMKGLGGPLIPSLPILQGVPTTPDTCPTTQGCQDIGVAISPSDLRDVLDIANSYGLPLWITENGDGSFSDSGRAEYTVQNLAVVHKAITDGMDIKGYTYWAFVDNFENTAYNTWFGLYSYDPVTLERTAKPSLAVISDVYKNGRISADQFAAYVRDGLAS
jgi:beta-galactosidase